ncbi:hypothetical protein [Dyella jiangningensis]|uniref:PhoU domain-containing protein n=1 Tax=Dyella jiangningensis TaxID=1379159 RepID=A0A328NYJ4_9GAMM|nr:hypothetical protein [Dyella jiangningensis]RAO75190.1 hypothetical protein CA260_13900 [Dyella jiangningensis]
MDHSDATANPVAQLLVVTRSLVELTDRAMSDSELSRAAADVLVFAARQAARLVEDLVSVRSHDAMRARDFVQSTSSADLDRAYTDLECLAEAAGMIRAHGIGSQYRAHLAYLMRYAAESACTALERAERSMTRAEALSGMATTPATALHI